MVIGSVRRVKIGRTRALTSPSTIAAIARAWLDSMWTPGKI